MGFLYGTSLGPGGVGRRFACVFHGLNVFAGVLINSGSFVVLSGGIRRNGYLRSGGAIKKTFFVDRRLAGCHLVQILQGMRFSSASTGRKDTRK